MAKVKVKIKNRKKTGSPIKIAKQKRSKLRAIAKKETAKKRVLAEKKRRNTGKSKSERVVKAGKSGSKGIVDAVVSIIVVAWAMIKGDSKRKITGKAKDDLLKRVDETIKNSLMAVPTNLFVVNIGFLHAKGGRPVLLAYIRNVKASMTDNESYLTPLPTMTDIEDMMTLEQESRTAKEYIDADIYLEKLMNLMRVLCVYIANTCLNSEEILKSAGVRANLKGGAEHTMTKVLNVNYKDTGYSGEYASTYDGVLGAHFYRGYTRDLNVADSPVVLSATSSTLEMVFKTMKRGHDYETYIAAVGAGDKEGPPSAKETYMPR